MQLLIYKYYYKILNLYIANIDKKKIINTQKRDQKTSIALMQEFILYIKFYIDIKPLNFYIIKIILNKLNVYFEVTFYARN